MSDEAARGVMMAVERPALVRAEAWKRIARRLAPWVVGLVLAMCWDRAVYLHVRFGAHAASPELAAAAAEALERKAWYKFLWILGRAELWLVVAAALLFAEFGASQAASKRGVRRAVFLTLCVAFAGGATEVAKLLFRRLRPDQTNGWYEFRPFTENFFSAQNLGLPSSHAGVSFGAAFALCWMFPRAAPVFICAGIGCSLSRLLVGAHFLSDVLVGTGIAFFVVLGVYALDRRNNRGQGIEQA